MNKRPDRKSRRGFIEKKRRDRLNSSLMELKRLVPEATKRELSEKLEKADILQLAVDYLKDFKKKNLLKTEQKNVELVDFETVGYRDCISEISRFFSDIEDSQNPMHLRLLSHLQYFTDSVTDKPIKSEINLPVSSCNNNVNKSNFLLNLLSQNFLLKLHRSLLLPANP